jgi:DNA-binding GntR family transcriptional regulator
LVLDAMRQRILDGTWPPGTRLVEEHIAQELGVSRNPVREAVRVLEAEGLVATAPRRSVEVATIPTAEAIEIFEVRLPLEALAARLAAARAGPDDVARLRQLVDQGADGPLDPAALTRHNDALHNAVLEVAGNGHLLGLAQNLRGRIGLILRQNADRRLDVAVDEHTAIVEAIAAGDQEAAALAASRHVESALAAYRQLVAESPGTGVHPAPRRGASADGVERPVT